MPQSNPNKWLIFMNLPIQMGIIIGGGVWLGLTCDAYFKSAPWCTVVCSLVFVGIALYVVLKQVQKLNS